MRIALPIEEVNRDLKLCKISSNPENVKFIAVIEVNDLGLVTDVTLLELGGSIDLLQDIILELEPDLFISDRADLEVVEAVVGNGAKLVVTPSDVLEEAVRDLILGRAEVIPGGKVSLRYAN
ncbi:MAG: hypothetical protein BA066_05355 [Candidatus Korarchaeota archaeon NZ13-K]|nr:MAG: hypothetical protein BA066_05355 [Candidatus Korarchaeota archaeon NZ13-K]